MQELLKGPNEPGEDDGLTTALPRDLILRSARSGGGTLTVDVSSELLDEPAPQLRLAVAQIVFTASELEGVRAVRVRVDGKIRAWPDGEGELQHAALTVYDFPGLAESAQPRVPTDPEPSAGCPDPPVSATPSARVLFAGTGSREVVGMGTNGDDHSGDVAGRLEPHEAARRRPSAPPTATAL